MLDLLPAPVRHFALMLASALAAWALGAYTSWGLTDIQLGIAGVILTQIALYITKLTKQYGVGANDDFKLYDEIVEDIEDDLEPQI